MFNGFLELSLWMTLNYTFEQLFSAFKDSFNLALTKFKEQKVVKSWKS